MQDWINEGFQKGMEKGMEKGEVTAIREGILDVLVERFGAIKQGIGA
ncbi:MAG: hypothetical protein H5U00_11465, partial [Clostridia bacterium]|nr:hypothetical protein [Clostridia bacterium]